MGWTGRVEVTFIVGLNGYVKESRVIKSSSYAVLDRKVLDALREAAPFPKPPAETKLTIPVNFQLTNG